MAAFEIYPASSTFTLTMSGPAGPSGPVASIASGTHAAVSKTTPVDADEIPLADSAASFGLKKLTWANLKATAKAYFDTLYATIAHTQAWSTLTGTLDILPFNTANGPPTALGELSWDQAEETLSLFLKNGTVLQVGEEVLYHAENNTVSIIADGTPVQYAGTVGNSGKLRVIPWDGTAPKYFMGIATGAIAANGGTGYVTDFGKVRGIQTNGANYGETWVNGDVIYAVAGGAGLTKVEPTAAGIYWQIGTVVSAHATNGTLFIHHAMRKVLVSADITDASSTATANVLVKYRSDRGLFGSGTDGNGVEGSVTSGDGVYGRSTSGRGVRAASDSGTGLQAQTDTGTYHALFGGTGDNRSFVQRVSGLFGWFRGAFKQTIGSPATLGADRAVLLPDASGNVALTAQTDGTIRATDLDFANTADIGADLADADEILVSDGGGNTTRRKSAVSRIWTYIAAKLDGVLTIAGAKTFTGQLTATTQTAAAGGSLMTRDLGDARYLQTLVSRVTADTDNATTTLADTGLTVDLAVGVWNIKILSTMVAQDFSSEPGFYTAFNTTGSMTMLCGSLTQGTNNNAGLRYRLSTAGGFPAGGIAGLVDIVYEYDFTVNVTTAGTLKLQFKQNASSVKYIRIASGSYMIATKLP